jgi:hypothetical protein
LRQGYPVKELLNPIRKELVFLMSLSLTPMASYFKKVKKAEIDEIAKAKHHKSLFIILIAYISNIYLKINKQYHLKEKTWLSLEMIMIMM